MVEMTDSMTMLRNPLIEDIGPIAVRIAQQRAGLELPEDIEVISADTHWEISEDIFYENFPAHLKEEAPRVWFDQYWHLGYKGQMEALGTANDTIVRIITRGIGEGSWNMNLRNEHMDIEGVEREIVYPQSLLGFIRHPRYEIQENMYRVYNDYIAGVGRRSPGRFHGVGVCSNWWDPAKAESAVQQIVDLGLKTLLVPITAGKGPDGKTVHYGDPVMERFWDVVAESGLPVTYHIGENPDHLHRGSIGTSAMVAFASFQGLFGQLVFGGVFDRHPDLKVIFAEGGIAWVPPALQDAETIFDSYRNGDLLETIERRPTEYWRHNCYATFQNDLLGLNQIDLIGADRIMWGSDYPHSEGTYGYGWSSMRSVVEGTTPENVRKILGGTAREVYRL
jgi:predicted TIM-barrel fold metal-dependent hydrolase